MTSLSLWACQFKKSNFFTKIEKINLFFILKKISIFIVDYVSLNLIYIYRFNFNKVCPGHALYISSLVLLVVDNTNMC